MSFENLILNNLRSEQLKFAAEALSMPGADKNAFEYGMRVGIFDGYQRAMNLITKLLTEEKSSDREI
jgi:hypothetical protein